MTSRDVIGGRCSSLYLSIERRRMGFDSPLNLTDESVVRHSVNRPVVELTRRGAAERTASSWFGDGRSRKRKMVQ